MKMKKASGKGGINMDARCSDRIKDSLAKPDMNMQPSLTDKATPKGKNFVPNGMKARK